MFGLSARTALRSTREVCELNAARGWCDVNSVHKIWLVLLCVVVAAFAACGGDDNSTSDAGPDAATEDSPSITDAYTDAGPSMDADAHVVLLDACVPIEGGLACDPGHIQCGTSSCIPGSQFCCITNDASTFACDQTSMPMQCMGMMNSEGTTMYCDEAANCPDAQVCCGFVGTGGGYATSCQPSCGGNAIQFCHGSAECASGTCVGQNCNGVHVETCGALSECP